MTNVQPCNSTFMEVIKGYGIFSRGLLQPNYLYLLVQLKCCTSYKQVLNPKHFLKKFNYELPLTNIKKYLAFLPVPQPRTQSKNKQQRQQKNAEASNSSRGKMTHEISSFRWLRNDDDIISRDRLRGTVMSPSFLGVECDLFCFFLPPAPAAILQAPSRQGIIYSYLIRNML